MGIVVHSLLWVRSLDKALKTQKAEAPKQCPFLRRMLQQLGGLCLKGKGLETKEAPPLPLPSPPLPPPPEKQLLRFFLSRLLWVWGPKRFLQEAF